MDHARDRRMPRRHVDLPRLRGDARDPGAIVAQPAILPSPLVAEGGIGAVAQQDHALEEETLQPLGDGFPRGAAHLNQVLGRDEARTPAPRFFESRYWGRRDLPRNGSSSFDPQYMAGKTAT